MLPSAKLRIELGKNAKEYIRMIDRKVGYKRSKVEYKSGGGALEIKVTSSDSVALISAIGGVLKQLKIITGVDRTLAGLI